MELPREEDEGECGMMTVKELKNMLTNLDDDLEIFIRNTVNPTGNIEELYMVESSTHSVFGQEYDCIILNTHTAKKMGG